MMKISKLVVLMLIGVICSCSKSEGNNSTQEETLKKYVLSNIFYEQIEQTYQNDNGEDIPYYVDIYYEFMLNSEISYKIYGFTDVTINDSCSNTVALNTCYLTGSGLKGGTLLKDDEESIVWKQDTSTYYYEITKNITSINLKTANDRNTKKQKLSLSSKKELNSKISEKNNIICPCSN